MASLLELSFKIYVQENLSNSTQILIQDEKSSSIITWPENFDKVIFPLKMVISEGFVNILNKLGEKIQELIEYFKHIKIDPQEIYKTIEEFLVAGAIQITVTEHIDQNENSTVVQKAILFQNLAYVESKLGKIIEHFVSENLPFEIEES